uniref:Beta-defensin-like domain-containing protein n=1 Tax=Malurus cyaneus samueli TaxID=2593467 RepID=A0A8C5X8G2_9PASS
MKILFLLFLLILLLLHGAAANAVHHCILQGGYCSFGECPPDAWSIGSCSETPLCCKGPWH